MTGSTDKGGRHAVSVHGQELRSERRPHPQLVPSRLEGGAEVESGGHPPEQEPGASNSMLRRGASPICPATPRRLHRLRLRRPPVRKRHIPRPASGSVASPRLLAAGPASDASVRIDSRCLSSSSVLAQRSPKGRVRREISTPTIMPIETEREALAGSKAGGSYRTPPGIARGPSTTRRRRRRDPAVLFGRVRPHSTTGVAGESPPLSVVTLPSTCLASQPTVIDPIIQGWIAQR